MDFVIAQDMLAPAIYQAMMAPGQFHSISNLWWLEQIAYLHDTTNTHQADKIHSSGIRPYLEDISDLETLHQEYFYYVFYCVIAMFITICDLL